MQLEDSEDSLFLGDMEFFIKSELIKRNLKKIKRALVLDKSILIEGSPGKISLIIIKKICQLK